MGKREREKESTEVANKRLKSEKLHDVRDRSDCPYLSTINRTKLNFDNERKCAATLQTLNIYMCLVCGEMYHGRGSKTPAYAHALHMEHYIYIDTLTGQIWCIPDLYEVRDDSLTDIQHNNNPTYEPSEVKRLLSQHITGHRVIDQTEFTVGYVGLNNLKETDYMNAVLQPLLHVRMLAEHYMMTFSYKKEAHRSPLRDSFSELCRKVWNPYNYVGQVSPRSFVEVVSKLSGGKYRIAASADPQQFLHFLLGQLIQSERRAGRKAGGATVVERAFQGKMRVTSRDHRVTKDAGSRSHSAETVAVTSFLTLPLTLPSAPLVKEESQQNIIQQEHLQVLLQKYNGTKESMLGLGSNRTRGSRYIITELPRSAPPKLSKVSSLALSCSRQPAVG
ncbi:putative mRNA-splicing protein ubp10 [Diplonema papillatum]|nr:putative mRNA-splicing protein ubp10 [Diplonema papillatum]